MVHYGGFTRLLYLDKAHHHNNGPGAGEATALRIGDRLGGSGEGQGC